MGSSLCFTAEPQRAQWTQRVGGGRDEFTTENTENTEDTEDTEVV